MAFQRVGIATNGIAAPPAACNNICSASCESASLSSWTRHATTNRLARALKVSPLLFKVFIAAVEIATYLVVGASGHIRVLWKRIRVVIFGLALVVAGVAVIGGRPVFIMR